MADARTEFVRLGIFGKTDEEGRRLYRVTIREGRKGLRAYVRPYMVRYRRYDAGICRHYLKAQDEHEAATLGLVEHHEQCEAAATGTAKKEGSEWPEQRRWARP